MTLWLCLHLPQLPLDALHTEQPERAWSVVDPQQRLLALSEAAIAAGLRPGLLSRSAMAIVPNLCCLPRQPAAEQEALHSLASWCFQFTPQISLLPPSGLLLEVGGSLKLFKTLTYLRRELEQGVRALGYRLQTGVAPTPRGAQLLAQAGVATPAISLHELGALTQPLPVTALGWEDKVVHALRAVGVNRVGECLALPAAGFRKRYGQQQQRQLEQLMGRVPDLRDRFQPPPRFRRSLELFSESDNIPLLLPGFERLFKDLEAVLLGLDCGVMRIDIRLLHARAPTTTLSLGLQSPSRDARYWLSLLEEHFQRLDLPAPVRAIAVHSQDFCDLSRRQTQFWQQADVEQRQQLWERLAARLGPSAIRELRTQATHCPEQAGLEVEAGQGGCAALDERPRPIWLLATPRVIQASELSEFCSFERLQTAWWDQPCERDYYRARNRKGQRLWVFREHAPPRRWFVHGVFG